MKLKFYVLSQNINIPREYRKNRGEYVAKHWQQYCGSPTRPGDFLSYWQTGNEFYLNYESAYPVEAQFPDEKIQELPKRPDWNVFTLSQPDFETIFKGNVALEELIDAFVLHYIKDPKTASKIKRLRYEPTIFTKLVKDDKSYTGPLFSFTMAYRTFILNEVIGNYLGKQSFKVATNGKLDHIILFADPTFLRRVV